jgi:hypothetical protein
VTAPEQLARAVAECGFTCCECQSTTVRLDHAPALGWLPVIAHWQLADGTWCPALSGDPAASRASWDLLDALAAAMAPVGHYGEPVWHRRQLSAA